MARRAGKWERERGEVPLTWVADYVAAEVSHTAHSRGTLLPCDCRCPLPTATPNRHAAYSACSAQRHKAGYKPWDAKQDLELLQVRTASHAHSVARARSLAHGA